MDNTNINKLFQGQQVHMDPNAKKKQQAGSPEAAEPETTVTPQPTRDIDWQNLHALEALHFKSALFANKGTELRSINEVLSAMPAQDRFLHLSQMVDDVYRQEFPGKTLPPFLKSAIMDKLVGVPEPQIANPA